MKLNSATVNESEDLFSFTKPLKKEQSIFRKKLTNECIKFLTFMCVAYAGVSLFQEVCIELSRPFIHNNLNEINSNTLQETHQLKIDSAKFISNVSFDNKNYSKFFYELELNPLLTNTGYSSLLEYFSKHNTIHNLKDNESYSLNIMEDRFPFVYQWTHSHKENYVSIIVPVNETITNLKTNERNITTKNIFLTFKLIDNHYQIIEFNDFIEKVSLNKI